MERSVRNETPIVDVCGDYLAIADKNSNTIYIFNKKGKVGEVNTSYPIIKIEVAQQGVVAALLEMKQVQIILNYMIKKEILSFHTNHCLVKMDSHYRFQFQMMVRK